MESNEGICISLSSGPLDPPPAKNNLPSAVTGEGQQAEGIPFRNHFSVPLFKSYPIICACPAATICLPAFVSQTIGVQYEAGDNRFCSHLREPVAASSARIFESFNSSRTRITVPSTRM